MYYITENNNSDSYTWTYTYKNLNMEEENKKDIARMCVIDKTKDIKCLCPGKCPWDSHLRSWCSYPPTCW